MIKITNADEAGRNNLSGGMDFALPRLISRPQEGSGEECGRVSEYFFFAPEFRIMLCEIRQLRKIYRDDPSYFEIITFTVWVY